MCQNPLTLKLDVMVLIKGFVVLNLAALPFSLLITLYIGIMAGASPNAPSPGAGFATVAAFIFLVPLGVLLWHLLIGKGVDAILRITPLRHRQVSVLGMGVAAVLLVVAGNLFVDNLHQFRQGDYTMSAMAFVADLVGLALIAGLGQIRIPPLDRLFRIPR